MKEKENLIPTADTRRLFALRAEFTKLVESPSWKEYEGVLRGMERNWLDLLASEEPDRTERKDVYYKGVIYGIRLIRTLPSKIMEQANDLAEQTKKVKDYERTNNSDNFDSGQRAFEFGPDARVTADDNE